MAKKVNFNRIPLFNKVALTTLALSAGAATTHCLSDSRTQEKLDLIPPKAVVQSEEQLPTGHYDISQMKTDDAGATTTAIQNDANFLSREGAFEIQTDTNLRPLSQSDIALLDKIIPIYADGANLENWMEKGLQKPSLRSTDRFKGRTTYINPAAQVDDMIDIMNDHLIPESTYEQLIARGLEGVNAYTHDILVIKRFETELEKLTVESNWRPAGEHLVAYQGNPSATVSTQYAEQMRANIAEFLESPVYQNLRQQEVKSIVLKSAALSRMVKDYEGLPNRLWDRVTGEKFFTDQKHDKEAIREALRSGKEFGFDRKSIYIDDKSRFTEIADKAGAAAGLSVSDVTPGDGYGILEQVINFLPQTIGGISGGLENMVDGKPEQSLTEFEEALNGAGVSYVLTDEGVKLPVIDVTKSPVVFGLYPADNGLAAAAEIGKVAYFLNKVFGGSGGSSQLPYEQPEPTVPSPGFGNGSNITYTGGLQLLK